MFLETLKSEGLAHLSYIIGEDGGPAAVIDPRRDISAYVDAAARHGARITAIFETHRNEDIVSGGKALSGLTGAPVLHGAALNFGYGAAVREGETVSLGPLRLSVLETPGHTDESISIVVRDTSSGAPPVGVFTGDALFVGAVGRTDFYPDRAEEVAGKLYDSIFGKLLPLGDQAVLWPAHGAGSVCGSGMADREVSTLGHERMTNPDLRAPDRDAFIAARLEVNRLAVQAPYFRTMEEFNQNGPPPLSGMVDEVPLAPPLDPDAFAAALAAEGGMVGVDIRRPEAWCGAHLGRTLALPLPVLSGYAGWFLPIDRPIGLIADTREDVEAAMRQLVRMGFDHVACTLGGGLHSWETAGRPYDTARAIHVGDLHRQMRGDTPPILLDVRSPEEVAAERLPGATEVFLGDLTAALDDLPSGRPVVTFCGSGLRAVVAASLLRCHGRERVDVCLGSMAAWKAQDHPTV